MSGSVSVQTDEPQLSDFSVAGGFQLRRSLRHPSLPLANATQQKYQLDGDLKMWRFVNYYLLFNRVKQAIAKKEETMKTLREQHQVTNPVKT